MNQMFYENGNFRNSGSSDINNWRPISCSNFGSMFQSSVFNQPVGNWPISASNINMSSMFRGNSLNQNIGAWDVSRVTNMGGMFQSNGAFNNSGSADINNWRPISCSNFTSMFQSATAFNQPIGGWQLPTASNIAVTMSQMFLGATLFNQNIGSWNTSAVTNMSSMFQNVGGAPSFDQNIGAWNVSNVTNFANMFFDARNFKNGGSNDINNWTIRTASAVNMSSMFESAGDFNRNIGSWNTSAVTNMSRMFTFTGFNQNISLWNTSAVTDMSSMFRNNSAFNQPIGSWNVSNVTSMTDMFTVADAFNQDIGNWNVSNVASFGSFMGSKTAANYSFLHTIYDGWIRNRLQPQRTINFNTINYSSSAAEGKALLERPYVTQSVVNIQDSSSFINIVTQDAHLLTPNNKIFIYNVSGSISGSINGLRTVLSTGSATEFTLSGSVFNPADIYDMGTGLVITGYGWSITDGDPV
jgi:surface protein